MAEGAHIGSSGSKVILLGEHAVVHGVDALVVGMQRGMQATARRGPAFSIQIPAWPDEGEMSEALRVAFFRMFDALAISDTSIEFNVVPQIPARAGLGASAALGVACARAVRSLLNCQWDDDTIFNAVWAFENVFHHNSSGVDIRAAATPGPGIYNRKGRYEPLNVPVPPLMVVHSGAPGATRDTVQRFSLRLQTGDGAKAQLSALEKRVQEGIAALKTQNWELLGKAMTDAHRILSWFEVSTGALDKICELAGNTGALGAKLTGGGGGGCAVILLADETQRKEMQAVFERSGYTVVM